MWYTHTYTHNGILLGHKKTNVILPPAETWIHLKDFMLSEMSEKDKYMDHKNMTLICGIKKYDTTEHK